ncbi:hypothetical protein Tco_0835633 [Tanacetum coccineum]
MGIRGAIVGGLGNMSCFGTFQETVFVKHHEQQDVEGAAWVILRSSAESEYSCLASTTCEIIWVVKIVKDLGVEGLLPVNLYCDSSSAISIAGNPVFHEKTKHFEVDLHLVRYKVADGVVKILKVVSTSNVAVCSQTA